MDPSPPPEADGSSNGASGEAIDDAIDDFLASLLIGQVRVKVDPASGKIVEVRETNPLGKLPLDSPTEQA